MIKHAFIVPRWGGNPKSDWYRWLRKQIRREFKVKVTILDMPGWNQPSLDKAISYLEVECKNIGEETVLIGHSVGCQAILRFIDYRLKSNPGFHIGGALFVAGWFEVDEPWKELQPWLNWDNSVNQVLRGAIRHSEVVLSNNDPITKDHFWNQTLWEQRIGSHVTIAPERKHFNAEVEPALVDAFGLLMNAE